MLPKGSKEIITFMKDLRAGRFWGRLLQLSSKSFSTLLQSKYPNIIINKYIILPVILYEYETSPLTLKAEFRLMVSENQLPR
jgi:hypothetical protein